MVLYTIKCIGGESIPNPIDFSYIVCITIAVAQLLKKHDISVRYIPFLNLLTSVSLMILFEQYLPINERIIKGIITGLSTSGIYDTCKSFKK
jgi:hypothetical protein